MAEFYGGHDTGGNDITLEEEEEIGNKWPKGNMWSAILVD